MSRTDKCSFTSIFALILKRLVQVLNVHTFDVKIYRQNDRKRSQNNGQSLWLDDVMQTPRDIYTKYGPLQFAGAATTIDAPQIYKPRPRKE